MRSVRLRIAGVTLAVRSAPAGPGLDWPAEYRPFLVPRGSDIVLDARWGLPPRGPRGPLLFESGGAWAAHGHGRERWYALRTRGPAKPPDRLLRLDASLRRGTLHVSPSPAARSPRFALGYPLDDLLFQHHLAARGSLVVHACGLVVDGRAVVFAGPSGAGKTTTARLWRRHQRRAVVLSDDRVVLRERAGRFWAHGTPWHGEARFASAASAPLGALFFLRQARAGALRPLGRAEAAARLMARTFPPPWDARGVARVLEACARVASSAPAYELRFRKDAGAVRLVLEALARAAR